MNCSTRLSIRVLGSRKLYSKYIADLPGTSGQVAISDAHCCNCPAWLRYMPRTTTNPSRWNSASCSLDSRPLAIPTPRPTTVRFFHNIARPGDKRKPFYRNGLITKERIDSGRIPMKCAVVIEQDDASRHNTVIQLLE